MRVGMRVSSCDGGRVSDKGEEETRLQTRVFSGTACGF
jgi:hypothetical protein